MTKRYYIHTLGCQMNVYDSERLAWDLEHAGWQAAQKAEQAQLLILNTCTVRQLAEQKAFSLLGRWSKQKVGRPDTVIGMIGCLAQHLGEKVFTRSPAVDFLAGPRSLNQIPEMAERARKIRHQCALEQTSTILPECPDAPRSRISAYVAVMDGCNQFCSYCAVPQARGRETSRPQEDILSEIRKRVAAGTREVILLGQNINRYGLDLPEKPDLAELLYRVAEHPNLSRVRFLTSHPKAFTSKLIRAMVNIPQLCPALHLPLQSGSNSILRAMHRGYTLEEYLECVAQLRSAVTGLVLSTDLIVGFPGESEEDFQATLNMVHQVDFYSAYCFKFSPRVGTAAARLPGQIQPEIQAQRLNDLVQAVELQAQQHKLDMIGKQAQVLVEQNDPKENGYLYGRTRNNHLTKLKGPENWLGKEIEVRIVGTGKWSLTAEPLAILGEGGPGPVHPN